MSTASARPARDPGLYFLDGGASEAVPDVVGNKAAGLMRMAAAGLPVPPGFVLGTSVCRGYAARGGRLGEDVITLVTRGIRQLERDTGRRLAGSRRPLLVSVRSGAAVSMPGMLDTLLNIGLCDDTVPALVRDTGDPRFVWDSYRRLIESYGQIVEDCEPAPFSAVLSDVLRETGVPDLEELGAQELRDVVARMKAAYAAVVGRPFPQDPMRQLLGAVEAVLRSWDSPRAAEYRRVRQLSGRGGTAVTVQAMVFGNLGMTSGSGVGFTRDPATGSHRLYLDFLPNAQGEDVVSGRLRAGDAETFVAAVPGLGEELHRVAPRLEALFGDAQDFEFTVEDGTLWMLQTRAAKRTPWAALQIAVDLADEGLIEPATACARLRGYDLDQISRVRLAAAAGGAAPAPAPVGAATPASAGVAAGPIALTIGSAQQFAARGERAILLRPQPSTDDIAGLAVCGGLLTTAGSRTSHAAVVARELGVVCLVGCSALSFGPGADQVRIGDWQGASGEEITLDGSAGLVYAGALPLVEERPAELVARVRSWERAAAQG